MKENRLNPRFKSIGRAYIPGILEKETLLKNLSITGGCLQCSENTDKVIIGDICTIEITAKSFFKNIKFSIKAECKWIQKTGRFNEIGFKITGSPTGISLKNYIDFITSHSTLT